MESLRKELKNLSHTLNDINTSVECSKKLIEGHIELVKRLEPRMEVLKTRIDFLTIELGRYEDEKSS